MQSNLLKHHSLLGTLRGYLMLDTSHSALAEGTDVGIIGGLAVALWFLILDTLAGQPFQTPSLLGQVLLFADSTPDTRQIVFGAILVYTAFHFAVFALIGMGLVVLVHWGVRDPVVRYALLPVFLSSRCCFMGSSRSSPNGPMSCSPSGP
jgi:hypothetical protein